MAATDPAIPTFLTLPGTDDRMPVVAYGTWTVWQEKPGEIRKCVADAIATGYRHVDCAWVYDNEKEVGEGIADKIADGTIKREDLFVTSKIWDTYHSRERAKLNVEKILARLQLERLDLCLIHWPTSMEEADNDNFPKNIDGEVSFDAIDIVDTWKGLEDAVKAGLVRNIGLSNFNSKQIQRIIDAATIQPCVIQIEVNPTFTNQKLIDFAKSKDIAVFAYAPLGAPGRPWAKENDPCAIEDKVIKDLALKKGKTTGQVILRWHFQQGRGACVKSLNADRIKGNLEVFDFDLTAEEIAQVSGLNQNFRLYKQEIATNHPEYPFHIEF